MRASLISLVGLLATGAPASAQCGGEFGKFVQGLVEEAVSLGHDQNEFRAFLSEASQDSRVLKADRGQGVFRKNFIDFSQSVISRNRLETGRAKAKTHAAVLQRINAQFGIAPGVLLAFWALETDFGAVQGDFNTLNALVTLAHDCRRPDLFRPQVFAAYELYRRGDFDPRLTRGAWAGEIGQVQMLPDDILRNGADGDGDGRIDLKGSSEDALLSGARMLSGLGWRPGEPWLQEVTVPSDLDWSLTGLNQPRRTAEWAALGVRARHGELARTLPGAILLPMGRHGPAFLAYPNFRVYFEWNKSFVYVTTAAYFATRLEGAQAYDAGQPDPGLSGENMKRLQEKLAARGHDVGRIDGVLGEKTREAVQAEQIRLGMPADAWPTAELLDQL